MSQISSESDDQVLIYWVLKSDLWNSVTHRRRDTFRDIGVKPGSDTKNLEQNFQNYGATSWTYLINLDSAQLENITTPFWRNRCLHIAQQDRKGNDPKNSTYIHGERHQVIRVNIHKFLSQFLGSSSCVVMWPATNCMGQPSSMEWFVLSPLTQKKS